MGEVWRPWRLLGASFWEEVTSLKLPPQKNEVPRGDLEEFWLNFEASGVDFRFGGIWDGSGQDSGRVCDLVKNNVFFRENL